MCFRTLGGPQWEREVAKWIYGPGYNGDRRREDLEGSGRAVAAQAVGWMRCVRWSRARPEPGSLAVPQPLDQSLPV